MAEQVTRTEPETGVSGDEPSPVIKGNDPQLQTEPVGVSTQDQTTIDMSHQGGNETSSGISNDEQSEASQGSNNEGTVVKGPEPKGVHCLAHLRVPLETYRYLVLGLTYLAYASFFSSRRALSIVRSSLANQAMSLGYAYLGKRAYCPTPIASHHNFSSHNGIKLPWPVDLSFPLIYSIATFGSGIMGDRYAAWKVLTIGLGTTALFSFLFGLGRFIHSWLYYFIVQVFLSLGQSSAWPSTTAVLQLWFNMENRSILNGFWNSHFAVGNILGTIIASNLLRYGWAWSIIVHGFINLLFAILMLLLFLVIRQPVGAVTNDDQRGEHQPLVQPGPPQVQVPPPDSHNPVPQNFIAVIKEAWKISEVRHYAGCLFFSNAVTTLFLYWLPFNIRLTDGKCLSDGALTSLSLYFDFGGVLGVILAGVLSFRWTSARANKVAAFFLFLLIPYLSLFWVFGDRVSSITIHAMFMLVMGISLNAPNALITSVASTEYSATSAGIIEGTGSLGTFLGLLLTSLVYPEDYCSQINILWFFMAGSLFAMLCLIVQLWDGK